MSNRLRHGKLCRITSFFKRGSHGSRGIMKGRRNQGLNQVGSRRPRSNSALLTDAYTSPLRAQHGAAKRGR